MEVLKVSWNKIMEVLIEYGFKYALRVTLIDLIKGGGIRIKKESIVKRLFKE